MHRRPIVVGYDGSETSRRALAWSLDAGRRHRLPVVVVHAFTLPVPPVPLVPGYAGPDESVLRQGAEDVLAEAVASAARAAPDVEVSTRMVSAPAAVALLDGVDDAEMVVVGSRGLDGFSQLLVGSTGLQVATHATCPTVVIRAYDDVPAGPEAGRVVVGVDGSEISEQALEFAFEEAALMGAGLTALHAWDAPIFDAPGKGGAVPDSLVTDAFSGDELRVLAESMAGWREKYPDVDVRQVVAHRKAPAALVAASAGAALVVVGSRGRGGFRALLLGSVSHAVLHHAHCPVAVVRPRD